MKQGKRIKLSMDQLRWIARASACVMECAREAKKGEGCVPGASSIAGKKLQILLYLVRHLGGEGIVSSFRKLSEEIGVSYAPVARVVDSLIRCGLVETTLQENRDKRGRGKIYLPVTNGDEPLDVPFFLDLEGRLSPEMEAWVGAGLISINELKKRGEVKFTIGDAKALILFRIAALCESASRGAASKGCVLSLSLEDLAKGAGAIMISAFETMAGLEKAGLVDTLKKGGRSGGSVFEIKTGVIRKGVVASLG